MIRPRPTAHARTDARVEVQRPVERPAARRKRGTPAAAVMLAAAALLAVCVSCSSPPPPRAPGASTAASRIPGATEPSSSAARPAAPTAGASIPQQAVRALFLQALQATQTPLSAPQAQAQAQAQASAVPSDPPALRHYILYDYLLAARLQHALQLAATPALDARIDAFLSLHGVEPVARDLRHDWLQSLAMRGRWDWFLPRANHVEDPVLLCERLAGQLAVGLSADSRAPWRAEALAVWGQPLQQPAQCDGVFDRLRQDGLITPARVEARARAALGAGDAALGLQLAAGLPRSRSAPLLLWARLLQSPAATLRALAREPAAPVESQALLAGFHRLALRDSPAAAALLPALQRHAGMTGPLRAQLRREAALGLAYDHDPAALPLFASLPEAQADEAVQQWRVRAALWSGSWPQALAWLTAMPPALGMQPRWQYWRGRATEAMQGMAAATPLYATLAGSRDYYGYLAADRLHRGYELQDQPTADDAAAQAALAQLPGLMRAHELLLCGLYDDAVAEWAEALAGSTPAGKVQAARLAARWGWYAQSIATLAAAGAWDDVHLRYPRPFGTLVAAAAERVDLPPDWILAVMRQESLFRVDAVSRANARGLMQLLPGTAQAVAQRWQLPLDGTLFDPATAVTLGAAHLRELLNRFQNQLALALAAYNAGSASLLRWLPSQPMAADIWIENIPYDETRGYVQHILEHIVAYAYTRDAAPPQLAALLPAVQMISAVSAANSAPARR